MKNEFNKDTIKFILNSKIHDFDFSKYSRRQLEFICSVVVHEYRKVCTAINIWDQLNSKDKIIKKNT